MHRAYICSPLGGNVSANIENAKRYARYALECGMAPFIPHFYALILDDNKKKKETSVCLPDFQCFGCAMQSGFSVMKLPRV